MSDNIVITVIALLYTASSGGIFYLNQHFFITNREIRQIVNWPLEKIRDAIVTSILRLLDDESITVFKDERARVEDFYDTILTRMNEEKKVLFLEKRLKNFKKLSMVNIALTVVFLFYIIFYLFAKYSSKVGLINIVQEHLKLFIFLLSLPWIIYFGLYFLTESWKTQLDKIEPRNTQERDE